MTKVLIFANDETTILNFRREIVSKFVEQGYDVLVCYPLSDHTDDIIALGCKVKNIAVSRHGTNILNDFRTMSDFKKIIKEYNPDIVLTYTVKPNIYGSFACQSKKVKYINNVTGLGTILQSNGFLSKLILKLQKKAYKKSSCVFFQNRDNYKRLNEVGVISSNTPVEILPGSGVNLEKQRFEEYPADDGVMRFLMVSRIRYDKGYKEYFDAAESIKEKYPNTEFHVIGWYEEETLSDRLNQLIDRGVITYHGKKLQEEVHKIMTKCDCIVHPSYHEGMANVLLEAAATGRPVIASNIPGCVETFDEGISGFGCNVKDSKSLEEAITKLINTSYSDRINMGKSGRIKMEKEFDRNIVANMYIEKIESLVRGSNK